MSDAPKPPDRENLHAVCDIIREMFDGDPGRVTDIVNDRMGPYNPAMDFVVAMLMVLTNAVGRYPAPARQKLIADIRKVADTLPAKFEVPNA